MTILLLSWKRGHAIQTYDGLKGVIEQYAAHIPREELAKLLKSVVTIAPTAGKQLRDRILALAVLAMDTNEDCDPGSTG